MNGFLDQFRGSGPLHDVTILDFSQMMMGPLATQLMGDLGALVIKVERPGVGEWERSYFPQGRRLHAESPYFLAMNRNKLSFTADLKSPEQRAHIYELVKHADAVIHNYRPGVMDRLELGYQDLLAYNQCLVYGSGSGYGAQGPLVERPGQDLLLQAMSGLAADSGTRNGPPTPVASPVVDASTGFLLAFAVVSAILDARQTSQPREVHASLLGTALLMQCQEALVKLNMDVAWERSITGLRAPWVEPPYGIYETTDGWIAIAMSSRELLVKIFDLPLWVLRLDDDAFYAKRDEINEAVQKRVRLRATTDLVDQLTEQGLWVAPVHTLEEVLGEPQVAANGYVETMHGDSPQPIRAVGLPFTVSGVTEVSRIPPPKIGEHNDIILQALDENRP